MTLHQIQIVVLQVVSSIDGHKEYSGIKIVIRLPLFLSHVRIKQFLFCFRDFRDVF